MKKLYAKYIEPYRHQFKTMDAAVDHMMVTPRRTLLMNAENLHKYRCKVTTAWKTRYETYIVV